MTYPVQTLVRNAHTALQDPDGVHWTAIELVQYLNAGQRELAAVRPDATAGTASFLPVQGARQTLPSTAAALIDVVRNTGGTKKSIRLTDRRLLESAAPAWQGMTEVTEFLHYMVEPREPRVFWLYPPAKATGGSIELVTSNYPADIATPSGATADTVTGDLSVADEWANALLSYVLFRAYAKDAETASNTALAAAHLAVFRAAIGPKT